MRTLAPDASRHEEAKINGNPLSECDPAMFVKLVGDDHDRTRDSRRIILGGGCRLPKRDRLPR
nr:hypothetical protein [uncultured Rhodopila sp.]